MDEFELGWLTGIIDGEGCLTIRILHRKTKHYGIRPRFQPQLSIYNCSKPMMDRISSLFIEIQVKHRNYLRRRNTEKNQMQYCIDVYSNGLRILLPLIKERADKKEQVEILLESLHITKKNLNRGHKGAWGSALTSNETLQKFDELRTRLQQLHGRQSKSLLKLKANDYISEKQEVQAMDDMRESRQKAINNNPKYQKIMK